MWEYFGTEAHKRKITETKAQRHRDTETDVQRNRGTHWMLLCRQSGREAPPGFWWQLGPNLPLNYTNNQPKPSQEVCNPKPTCIMVSMPFFPRATSEEFLLCRSSAGAELSFTGGGVGGLPPECCRIENLQNPLVFLGFPPTVNNPEKH